MIFWINSILITISNICSESLIAHLSRSFDMLKRYFYLLNSNLIIKKYRYKFLHIYKFPGITRMFIEETSKSVNIVNLKTDISTENVFTVNKI